MDDVTAGLQSDAPVPLKSVHVRAQLVDLAGQVSSFQNSKHCGLTVPRAIRSVMPLCNIVQVVVLQEYHNQLNEPIEAKYVFPLEDGAVVCGFEAFINDKHIIGTTTPSSKVFSSRRTIRDF